MAVQGRRWELMVNRSGIKSSLLSLRCTQCGNRVVHSSSIDTGEQSVRHIFLDALVVVLVFVLAVILEKRDGAGGEIVRECKRNKNSPHGSSTSQGEPGSPKGVSAVVDVAGKPEKTTGIRLAFVLWFVLEDLALDFCHWLNQYADSI